MLRNTVCFGFHIYKTELSIVIRQVIYLLEGKNMNVLTWYGISFLKDVMPNILFSRNDIHPFRCGYHKMEYTHKELHPDRNL